ncbi:hypothetical protein PCANC_16335 [Puccinia coronata f. sp. avenae]|uniref:Uncharacterized protein n=1 Tax=Puccinia coronata f. sp. avenae TaxID=200324 RepID=A0A2N5SK68_9BASI|nr:hypothetical protein PCANC_16335 [Puccinia coronata f. sp. avenae]
MDRNSRPVALRRRAEDLPGSSPGGVRPVEELDEEPLPPNPTVHGKRRNEPRWAEVMQRFAPDIQIQAYRANLQAFQQALTRVDAATVHILHKLNLQALVATSALRTMLKVMPP